MARLAGLPAAVVSRAAEVSATHETCAVDGKRRLGGGGGVTNYDGDVLGALRAVAARVKALAGGGGEKGTGAERGAMEVDGETAAGLEDVQEVARRALLAAA